MEIFLSWSGSRSQEVAELLRDWLPKVIQNLKPWISVGDIDKGSRWLKEISEKLENTNFGILCLTPENLTEPWILFEAGALSKAIGSSHICPVMLGFEASSLKGPLSQFQATKLKQNDMRKLLTTINRSLNEKSLPSDQLDESFEMWWPKLEENLLNISSPDTETTTERTDRDILEEILKVVRSLDRQSKPSEDEFILSRITRKALTTLTPREEKILRMRFGIGENKALTDEEISQQLGLTNKTVSTLIEGSLRKLRQPSRAKILIESLAELLSETPET